MGVRYVIGVRCTLPSWPGGHRRAGPDHAGRSGHSRPGAEKIRASSESAAELGFVQSAKLDGTTIVTIFR